jgi:hypothetical protein
LLSLKLREASSSRMEDIFPTLHVGLAMLIVRS